MHILQKRELKPEMEEGKLTCRETSCINEPETIARVLVESGCPPRLLQVEEEDLEHFFMRLIGESGVSK
jgi:ABC-2 type transport system ATP-binding protein